MSIKLLDFQEKPRNNIEELYKSGKRSAAAVVPTGGGKSFISMSVTEMMMDWFPTELTKDAINNLELLYLAPNTGILYQYRLHIAENMIFNHYFDEYKNDNLINKDTIEASVKYILDRILPDKIGRLEYNDVYQRVIEENKLLPEKDSQKIIEKIVSENLKNLQPTELEKAVLKAYPNFRFECYQNLSNIDFKTLNAKFVILDEAHRGGADTWIKELEKLIKSKKDSYFLSITATPERNSDDRSILTMIARNTGYTSDEILDSKYYASEYYLLDAIKDGRVINPKIVGFPCTLDESPEYFNIVNKIKDIQSKKPKNGSALDKQLYAYITIKNRMDEIIGKRVNNKTLSDEEWNIKKKGLIEQTLKGNKEEGTEFNPNGKYIAFIPDSTKTDLEQEDIKDLEEYKSKNNVTEDDIKTKKSNLKSKRNVLNNINNLQKIFGKDIKTLIYHATNTDRENDISLQQFGFLSSRNGGTKFIVTNKKLDEGVHVEDADGEIMLDVIQENKKNKLSNRFTQRFGRVIRAHKPDESLDELKIPIVYDYANNFMRNFELLKLNGKCILDYDQNATNTSEFFELAEIVNKNPKSVMKREVKGEKFLEFDLGVKKGSIKFPNFERKKEIYKKTASQRYNTLINVLEILEKYSISKKIDLKSLPMDTIINDDFFKKYEFSKNEIEKIKGELIDIGAITPNSKEYDLGEDLTKVKKVFFGVENDFAMKKEILKDANNIEKLARLGVIYLSKSERILPEYKDIIDINGFIKPSLKILNNDRDLPDIEFLNKFVGLNIITGTNYYNDRDEYGCYKPGTKDDAGNDIGGYDIYGYDRYGFNKDGIHKLTGQKYNEKQFTRIKNPDGTFKYINTITRKSSDVFGYDIDGINPETGFDNGLNRLEQREYIKHYWHKFDKKTGTYSKLYTEYNIDKYPPVDEYGATKSMKPTDRVLGGPFCKDRKSCNGNYYYDKYSGLNIDGFNKKGFKEISIIKNGKRISKFYNMYTSSEYDLGGRDYNDNLEPNLQKGLEILEDIFNNNNKLSNSKFRNQYILQLKEKYEKEGISLNDILDKALTMYRICPRLKYDTKLERQLAVIKTGFNDKNNEFNNSFNFIKTLSPKFHQQLIYSSDYKRQMNETFAPKMQKLFLEIQDKYESNIPTSISIKIAEYIDKYKELGNTTFLTAENSKRPEFRDFSERE
ncbi:MAG: DEAD/DEAH box helicase family protein [Clostridia bacterium]|nr:DEAD/DEAH box helicase family protein [Clostridia bacterium]